MGIGKNGGFMNSEREFCSFLVRSLRKKPSLVAFVYKIPDVPRTMKFIPPKPFDLDVRSQGRAFAIEAKFQKHLLAFGLRDLEPSQVAGLSDVHEATPGCAFVFLFAKVKRGDTRLYFWEWEEFLRVPSRLKKILVHARNYVPVDKEGRGMRSLFEYVSSNDLVIAS
jgi:hypothetical protein